MSASVSFTKRPALGAGIVMVCGSQVEKCHVQQRDGRLATLP